MSITFPASSLSSVFPGKTEIFFRKPLPVVPSSWVFVTSSVKRTHLVHMMHLLASYIMLSLR